MLQHSRKPSGAAVVVLTLALATIAAYPRPALAKGGGSHHESNHGEVYKSWSWTQVVRAVISHIKRPIKVIIPGDNSGPTCR